MQDFFKFIKALSVFTGVIIGVGIFGLPYIASKAGFFVVLGYFILLTAVTIAINIFYTRVIEGTEGSNYLPGHAAQYLGKKWKIVAFAILLLGTIGSLLAYIIVGGEFLNLFLSPLLGGSNLIWTLVFFLAGILLIFRGSKSLARLELFLLGVFLLILGLFFIKALPFIDFKNFTAVDFKYFTLPYGVILFSLWGATFIPELKEMVSPNLKLLNKVVITGTILSAVIYLLFIFAIFGTTGSKTSGEAMSGFINIAGNGILRFGFLFGLINVFDSFVCVGITLKKILWKDFGIHKVVSWVITCFLPLILFFFGGKEYISVIGFIGAFLLGIECVLIIFIYRNFLKTQGKKINPFVFSLCGVFLLGIIFETIYLLGK